MALAAAGFLLLPRDAGGNEAEFFRHQVFPILSENCFKCHSHGSHKIRGGLVLDSRAGLLRGGDSGPAIVPGDPESSRLIQAVRYEDEHLQMPPKTRLANDQVALLNRWVKSGAVWPEEAAAAALAAKSKISDEDRNYWFYRPLTRPNIPKPENSEWCVNEIDQFIRARLEAEGLQPAPEASRAQLIQRLYADLIGLPPTPAEVEAFEHDESVQAYEKVVDRLLASPRYGERWARHWLDLVRYAESDGFRADHYRPEAWRYRDYVIRSLNDDKPYDQFVKEQLAGDEIAPENPEVLVATGYLRHWIYEYNQRNVRAQWSDILNDVTDVTGEVFLGMGMACARCHDHKFDPILQKDYFRLQAFFTPMLPRYEMPLATPAQRSEYEARLERWEAAAAEILAGIEKIEKPHREAAMHKIEIMFPEDIQAMLKREPSERAPLDIQLAGLAQLQMQTEGGSLASRIAARIKGEEKERWEALREELKQHHALKPDPLPEAFVVTDVGPSAPPTRIPGREQAEPVEPGFPTVLGGGEPAQIQPVSAAPHSTGRRTALAEWMTRPDNPLTTRVMANRIWQYHFGRGLVATASDFGRLGEPPSHPELLDWLAAEFVRRGWSLKEMHRLMVTSATYRQGSVSPHAQAGRMKDPENRLYWRMNLRRLDAEQIRDALLAVSGELDLTMGGPSVGSAAPRRTIYTQLFRNKRDPLLEVFDAPDGYRSMALRNVTTTPPQALLMINGEWVLKRAQALAARLPRSVPDEAVRQAYLQAFGREPAPQERAEARTFLRAQENRVQREKQIEIASLTETMPGLPGRSIRLEPDGVQLRAPASQDFPSGDFTIEAYVLLDSPDPNSAVRTIASRWTGANAQPGWALGVTGRRSSFRPESLILQVVGSAHDRDEGRYEVIPSGLRIESGRPYYVAASFRLQDPTENGAVFYARDLSDPAASLQIAKVPHRVTSEHHSSLPLTLGGRHATADHRWHGLIDEVRLSSSALSSSELLVSGAAAAENSGRTTAGHWEFEELPGLWADSSPARHHLETGTGEDPEVAALADFCHVLLNSNEFLYVD